MTLACDARPPRSPPAEPKYRNSETRISALRSFGSRGATRSIITLILITLALAGCSDAPDAGSADVAFPDIHGVAIDPTDTRFVYVATHAGLYRGDGATWAHVGDSQNDLMGFTLSADGRTMWASGHPPRGGNLGLLRSSDAGETWVPIGGAGADFHALAVSPADPNRLYASWRGDVLRSDDAGGVFVVAAKLPVNSFAAHPTDPDVVYAASNRMLKHSDDAGLTWHTLGDLLTTSVAVSDAVYAGGQGFVARSTDGGETWTKVPLPHGDATIGSLSARGPIVVAASHQTGVYRSEDGGATWTILRAPTR